MLVSRQALPFPFGHFDVECWWAEVIIYRNIREIYGVAKEEKHPCVSEYVAKLSQHHLPEYSVSRKKTFAAPSQIKRDGRVVANIYWVSKIMRSVRIQPTQAWPFQTAESAIC